MKKNISDSKSLIYLLAGTVDSYPNVILGSTGINYLFLLRTRGRRTFLGLGTLEKARDSKPGPSDMGLCPR